MLPPSLWSRAPWLLRLYFPIRAWTCPFREVERHLPRQGTVVDYGCGYGLFGAWAARCGPERTVVAVDPDPARVEAAARVFGEERIRWCSGGMEEIPPCDALAAIDVLYMIPVGERSSWLEQCRARLRPGGRLLLKVMDERPRWKVAWDRFQDALAAGVLHRPAVLSHPDPSELCRHLHALGFAVERVDLGRGYLHPHLLLVANLV